MAERAGERHDEQWLRLVAPPDWSNPAPRSRYDLVVIGGGTAGLVSAAGAAGLGATVALVERHRLGGDCLNTGCVPSKALLRSARERPADFGAAMERMRRLRSEIAVHDSAPRFQGLGVDVFLGAARFTGPDRIEVAPSAAHAPGGGAATLRFRRAIVATGSRPAVPAIPGLAEAGFLTSETVWDLRAPPPRLAVLGGGPIGCELAQAFARFGARVVLFEAEPVILPRDDPDASAIVAGALRRDGVELWTGRSIVRIEAGAGSAVVHAAGPDSGAREVDSVLVAAGRAPNVEELGLAEAGIAFDAKRGIEVDEGLRTTNRRVYAAGDVCARLRFTHVADAHARIAIRNALFPGRSRFDDRRVPWCTFTDPEVAHVGHTLVTAARDGIRVRTFTQPFADVDRAVLDGETEGFARVHVKEGSDAIVGATVVGRHAGETISEIALAMAAGWGLGRLSGVVHPYPTRAEALRKLGDACRRTRLTPRARRLIERWLRWGLR
jgi:pyruvate/2-oxoglutarate dehydrogenase complex dihydrolipoamide dehydrogenase (E3) component